jgi:hypothetical protein
MPQTMTDDCDGFNFDALLLKHGAHGSAFAGECCLVEAANRLTVCKVELREKYGAAETFTDDHPSISRVIRSFSIAFNDGIKDDQRRTDLLKPYAVKILGTKTNAADEETRAWMATDWLVRVHTPAWLDLAGLSEHAASLRSLAPLTSSEIALAAQQTIRNAADASYAAGAAAGDAARAAAGDAAWAAAGAAARAAAWDAAWDAARAAAWDAAWAAARAAAGAAARAAAWDAARAKLAPTVEQLQASAIDLLDRMIAVDSRAAKAA